ncbi:transposable element Tcb2 transposase [Trichonephila clavipes]|uniref:Transposable element Tcb2 transposase n=1 Tax=Trichonephila clavipes TaxID=2585209 RepID=A0A8X6W5M8_TRICX|nr:transposable element Tcb2 transposase [Trichonephila clavipes]
MYVAGEDLLLVMTTQLHTFQQCDHVRSHFVAYKISENVVMASFVSCHENHNGEKKKKEIFHFYYQFYTLRVDQQKCELRPQFMFIGLENLSIFMFVHDIFAYEISLKSDNSFLHSSSSERGSDRICKWLFDWREIKGEWWPGKNLYILQSMLADACTVRKVGGGRPRTTTAGDDRYIILQAKRGRRQSASVIAQQLSTATGRQVSRFTVARRLHKGGLFARRPERCLPLKVDHRRHRLQWCREHKNWTTDQWSRVLFTDESRFSTRSDSQRVLIWREIGIRFYTSNIKERHHYGGPGVLVWRGIMLNGRTELHIFDGESVIGDRYCEEVLHPHVRLFRGAIGPDFIFMDDNARPHRTLAVEELLESEDITRVDWPAYSSDLNPIEHVWDALGRHIAARLHHPENTQQLKQMLIEEWALLPQEMLHQLVLSMRRLCEATIADLEVGHKHQQVYRGSLEYAVLDAGLETELVIPFYPNSAPQDSPQQAQLCDFAHYHPSE